METNALPKYDMSDNPTNCCQQVDIEEKPTEPSLIAEVAKTN